jgi:hypothetical protein
VKITVTEGCDADLLRTLYADPYIARIGHDDRHAEPIAHPQVVYLSAWVGERFAGAFMAVCGKRDFELHALLRRDCLPWSRQLGRACLDWAFSKPIDRVTAWVIGTLKEAANYCRKLGFTLEGVRREACRQNGVPRDVFMLGMLRAEWESMKRGKSWAS